MQQRLCLISAVFVLDFRDVFLLLANAAVDQLYRATSQKPVGIKMMIMVVVVVVVVVMMIMQLIAMICVVL